MIGMWLTRAPAWLLSLPSPARLQLALKNTFSYQGMRSRNRFLVVVCWLEGDERGDDTRTVADTFTEIPGIKLVRSARVVYAPADGQDAWISDMRNRARNVLNAWNADLIVTGTVKKSEKY